VKFRVEVSPPAVEDAIGAWRFIADDSPAAADRWYHGLMQAIDSLDTHPRRCRRARESAEFDVEVRQLIYGSHRVLFSIQEDRVLVLHIRHTARRDFKADR
jgi:plasmid stabilization system protein ParE